MTRLALVATLLLVGVSRAADDPPGLAERMERIGRLPAEMVKAKKSDAEITDGLFLAALARLPGKTEKETALKHLSEAKEREEAARDLAWAVVNTKEFLKLHGLDKDVAAGLQLLNTLVEKWGKKKEDEKK